MVCRALSRMPESHDWLILSDDASKIAWAIAFSREAELLDCDRVIDNWLSFPLGEEERELQKRNKRHVVSRRMTF